MAKHNDKQKRQEEEIIEESAPGERVFDSEEAQTRGDFASRDEEIADNSADETDNRLEEAEAKYKRALADYQNLEKRMVEDRGEWIRQANRDLLIRILPILDTLTLAATHSEDKSLHVSAGQFLDILKSEGVTKIETKGRDFDGSTMEAVGTSVGEDGKVIEEARAGFMLHDKLLRPAQVIVGRS